MNPIATFVPAALATSLCLASCSSPDGEAPAPGSADPVVNASAALAGGTTEASRLAPSAKLAISSPDDTDSGADFVCDSDDACVAVPLIAHCCDNGWKIAVAVSEAQAFEAAEQCGDVRVICPEYRVFDHRVATCNTVTHSCAMVEPGDAASPASPE